VRSYLERFFVEGVERTEYEEWLDPTWLKGVYAESRILAGVGDQEALYSLLDAVRRQSTFDEVQGGLDESSAQFEARRCLSCGNCFECDNCYGMCPDNAVIKRGPGQRFEFNYDYCKGCGVCAAECPCGAIRMVPEEI